MPDISVRVISPLLGLAWKEIPTLSTGQIKSCHVKDPLDPRVSMHAAIAKYE